MTIDLYKQGRAAVDAESARIDAADPDDIAIQLLALQLLNDKRERLTEAIDVVISDLEALHAGIVRGDIKASSLVEQMLGSSIDTLRKAGA